MPRLLAFEYNDAEARVAVASSHGPRMVVEQAFCVSLVGQSEGAAVDLGQRLAAALGARGIGRVDALVALGRTQVELRQLSLPPCPDDELPELVRFQAMREFSALKDDWRLDFLPGDEDQPQRTVLAAAIEPALAQRIEAACDKAGVKPRRIVLRPCAAASLWRQSDSAADSSVRLLVDPLAGEAELTVLVDGREVFLRSARLPGDPLTEPEALGALTAEIRRTMVAAQNQLGGRRVESIVLFGRGEPCQLAAAEIGQRLEVPTARFDPLEGVSLSDELARTLPPAPGRFAAILGALRDELNHARPAIDFLHPRKPPEAKGRRRTYILAGLGVAVALLLCLGYRFVATNQLQNEIADLQERTAALKPKVVQAEATIKAAATVGAWVDDDLVWLDEFRWLAEHFPASKDAMLGSLKFLPGKNGGAIDMDGFARSVDTLDRMDENLRDARHGVKGKDKKDDRTVSPYSLFFKSTVVIDAASKDAAASKPNAASKKAPAASKKEAR